MAAYQKEGWGKKSPGGIPKLLREKVVEASGILLTGSILLSGSVHFKKFLFPCLIKKSAREFSILSNRVNLCGEKDSEQILTEPPMAGI